MSSAKTELTITGAGGREISLDISLPDKGSNLSVILFCHGFKGFKDWGTFNKVSEYFASAGFCFVKFNFSHNGVSTEDLSDITLPDVFAQNTFSMQLDEVKLVIDWLHSDDFPEKDRINASDLTLIGHSLGGAFALLTAANDSRVSRLITWGTPYNILKYADLENAEIWRDRGYTEVQNGRTKQIYKLPYSFRTDIVNNLTRFSIQHQLEKLDKPYLVIHGADDEVVPLHHAERLAREVEHAILVTIPDTGHTFGGSHPWTEDELPEPLGEVVEECAEFIWM